MKRLDTVAVWRAIQSAEGSVRVAARSLGASVAAVVAAIADDPNAVIIARRAVVPNVDTGPLPVFRLWVDDEEDEEGNVQRRSQP